MEGNSRLGAVVLAMSASSVVGERRRLRLLRRCGVTVDDSAIVFPGVRITGEARITLGAGCFVNSGCVLEASADITIGTNVALGNNVMLLTSHHDFSDPARRAGPRAPRPIVIEDGAWIAAGSIVLPGVRVGAGAVIAAGSVVLRDCEPHTLYGGSPARSIRSLD